MPHIHTNKNEHDLTITAYIIRTDTPEPKALLHMHRKLGKLLPVGGHVELDETPWQAAKHEIAEESGYGLGQLKILQPKIRIKRMAKVAQHPYPLAMNTHDIPGNHFHTDIEYGFIANEEPAQNISDGESVDLRWLTRNELELLNSDVIFENTKELYRFMFDDALQNWEAVDTKQFLLEYPTDYIEF